MLIDINKHIKVIRPEAIAVYPYSNSFYVQDEVNCLIDAGAGGKAYSDIVVDSVDVLLLSHYHFDHVNGISFFKNAQVMAGNEEALAYSNIEAYVDYAGYNRWEKLMGEAKLETFSSKVKMPEDVPVKPGFQDIKLNGVIKDGDVFDLGKNKLIAIHTPGHSHGHYAFYLEKEGILFSGDLDISPHGPWYGGGYSNFDDIVKSIDKLIAIKPKILVTSHRKVFYKDIEKHFRDYIDIALRKEERIYNYLAEPRSLNDITSQDLAFSINERTPHVVFWTKVMVLQHLHRLITAGKIIKTEEGHYIKK